jgi:hypothetical protein
MFISRPLFRLKDSVQDHFKSTNPEMPEWAVTTNKYYN